MASRREHLEIRNEGIIVALELDGVTGGPNYIEVDENQKLKRGCGDPALQDTLRFKIDRVNGEHERVRIRCYDFKDKRKYGLAIAGNLQNLEVTASENPDSYNNSVWHLVHAEGLEDHSKKRMFLMHGEHQRMYFYYNDEKKQFCLGGLDDDKVKINSVFHVYGYYYD